MVSEPWITIPRKASLVRKLLPLDPESSFWRQEKSAELIAGLQPLLAMLAEVFDVPPDTLMLDCSPSPPSKWVEGTPVPRRRPADTTPARDAPSMARTPNRAKE
jgi:hypothetical protein